MLNKKFTRIAVGLVLLGVLLISIIPSLYLYNSVDGVVNGRILVLHTPIAGDLHFTKKIAYGSSFKKNELIGSVTNNRVDQSFLHKLITEKKTLEARITSLDERVKTFTQLNATLKDNSEKYQEFSAKQLESLVKQETHKLEQEKAELERAKKEFDSSKILDGKQVVTKRELEKHEANLLTSQQRIIQIQSKIEEHANSLKAVQSGAFLGDGHNDSPYSKQRMDQLVIEISLATTTRDEAKNRLEGIDLQIGKEKERIAKAELFEFKSPYDSLVWRMPMSEGSSVVIASELVTLLECASVFLDVTVSESQFANIKPGDKLRYRLIGDTGSHTGTVVALRGSGSVQGDMNLAAAVSKDTKKEFRIWIAADPTDLDLTPENFFQIGRRVEAKIPRKWSVMNFLTRFVDVF